MNSFLLAKHVYLFIPLYLQAIRSHRDLPFTCCIAPKWVQQHLANLPSVPRTNRCPALKRSQRHKWGEESGKPVHALLHQWKKLLLASVFI